MSLRSLRKLKKFSETREERCELCAVPLGEEHQHLLDPRKREAICACDACALLFDGTTKLKRIPRDPRSLPGFSLPEEKWKALVPVKLAFVYRKGEKGELTAIFPSPAGITESVLGEWAEFENIHPRLGEMEPDVEALLVSRLGKEPEYLLAPMDRCFALVGILRRHWEGINGGDKVWPEVHRYLNQLKRRAR